MFYISRRLIHILSNYAPSAIDAHSKEAMSFYDRLSSIVDAIPTYDNLFLSDDFNAILPVDEVSVKNRCSDANRNAKMLQSFIKRVNLLASSVHAQGRNTDSTKYDLLFKNLI